MGIGDHFQSPMKGATRSTPSTYSVPHLTSYLSPSLALLQSPDASALLPASILLSQGLVSAAPPALEAPLPQSHSGGSLTSFRSQLKCRSERLVLTTCLAGNPALAAPLLFLSSPCFVHPCHSVLLTQYCIIICFPICPCHGKAGFVRVRPVFFTVIA